MNRNDPAASSNVEFVGQRRDVKIVASIPGRFSLANRRDSNGNRRQFACRAVNISQTTMMLAAPVSGPIGERVIAYFQEFGKIQGSIVHVMNRDRGFVIRIVATDEQRAQLLRKLIWLEKHTNCDVPDLRTNKRIVPQDPISTLTFSNCSMLSCFVIDMSASGVSVSADVVPPIGTVLAVGKVVGEVVRHFAEGFAVHFRECQDPARIEHLVICKL